jgi:hypothetical protein
MWVAKPVTNTIPSRMGREIFYIQFFYPYPVPDGTVIYQQSPDALSGSNPLSAWYPE